MPRRAAIKVADAGVDQSQPATSDSSNFPSEFTPLTTLRRQWKWAAFSQFYYTFAPIFGADEIPLKDIEDDLANGFSLVLPRIMQRLLFVLSYDRKISLDNWQTALRKQYFKRDPFANPIGLEPLSAEDTTRHTSVADSAQSPIPTRDGTADIKEEDHDDAHASENFDYDSQRQDDDAIGVDSKPPRLNGTDGIGLSLPKLKKGFYNPFLTYEQIAELETRETKDWNELSMLEKLDSLHLLTEWQCQNPMRLRQLMRSDGDNAEWRIEPIGYDAKRNAYWFIGPDRLWIQREIPKPPRLPKQKQQLKRKRTAQNKAGAWTTKRGRVAQESEPPAKKARVTRGVPTTDSPAPAGRGRAAKAQAKLKLNEQAKQLEALKREAELLARVERSSKGRGKQSSAVPAAKAIQPLGTRASRRLRGINRDDDDEWQEVPQEWLAGTSLEDNSFDAEDVEREGENDDATSVSELTELTDIEDDGDGYDAADDGKEEESRGNPSTRTPSPIDPEHSDDGFPKPSNLPDDFIEWETICTTLEEWEHIAERWEKCTHYAEKALYKMLANNIVPVVTAELREIERKRRLDDAVVHRKRSSRIAIKESEKEEAKLVARRKAEEDEKNSRARRAEIRQQKEEEARLRREQLREKRRQETEAEETRREEEAAAKEKREQQKRESAARRAEQNTLVDILGLNGTSQRPLIGSEQTPLPRTSMNGSSPSKLTGEDWELDCEICHRKGINPEDNTPMMCCGVCSIWQHIACHDYADLQSGRPKRNWDVVEFTCRKCYKKRHSYASRPEQPLHRAAPPPPPSNYIHTNGFSLPHTSTIRAPAAPRIQEAPSVGQRNKTISFSHYQPQQRGFTPATSTAYISPYTPSNVPVNAAYSTPSHMPYAAAHANGLNPNTNLPLPHERPGTVPALDGQARPFPAPVQWPVNMQTEQSTHLDYPPNPGISYRSYSHSYR